MGSYHSLTPCVSSPGTIVDMKALDKIVSIDAQKMTFTAQAGLEMVEAADALRKQKLQFILNIEIGNMTLGSAACCHTKDALDGIGFGQVNSFVTGVKWVSPSGELQEASEEKNPELLPLIRASYGLAGIVYEVRFKIKPLEIIEFNYEILDVESVTQDHVSQVIASNDCMVCWTIGHKLVIQTRNRATELRHDFLGGSRRFGWSFLGAFAGRAIREHSISTELTNSVEDAGFDIELGFYRLLSKTGGFTLYAPETTSNPHTVDARVTTTAASNTSGNATWPSDAPANERAATRARRTAWARTSSAATSPSSASAASAARASRARRSRRGSIPLKPTRSPRPRPRGAQAPRSPSWPRRRGAPGRGSS